MITDSFVEEVKQRLLEHRQDMPWQHHVRISTRERCYRADLRMLVDMLYPEAENNVGVKTNISRAMARLGWTKTSMKGKIYYVKPVEEVQASGY